MAAGGKFQFGCTVGKAHKTSAVRSGVIDGKPPGGRSDVVNTAKSCDAAKGQLCRHSAGCFLPSRAFPDFDAASRHRVPNGSQCRGARACRKMMGECVEPWRAAQCREHGGVVTDSCWKRMRDFLGC